MKKISIIVPCYNCECFIENTVNHLLLDVLYNYELILIDDGSTDGTYSKLLNLKQYYKNCNIFCYTQENKGVSFTRNRGIELSSGDIIVFLDADDLFSKGYINYIQQLFENESLDVVCCYRTNNVEELIDYNSESVQPKETTALFLLKKYTFSKKNIVFPCFAYKSSIIKNNNLLFSNDLKYGEDFEFVTKVLSHCNRSILIERKSYWYRISSASASKKITWRQTDVLEAARRSSDYLILNNNDFSQIYSIYMYNRCVFSILHRFAISNQYDFYIKFINEINVKQSMKIIVKNSMFGLKTRIASVLFLINPKLFYNIVKQLK